MYLLSKKLYLVSFLFLLPLVFVQAQGKLSPRAEISVFTIAPGHADDPLFTQFGHSAFRVSDPINRIDWIYDYGVFDFDAPNYYLNFARGRLNYMLAKRDYNRFEAYYKYLNRSLTEQVINLDSAQKQAVFNFLENNYLPENRFYPYDFFYDNCATRLPGVLKEVLGEKLTFDESAPEEALTFRDLIEPRLVNHRWGDLGIDLALGLPTDLVATRYQYMFLPFKIPPAFNKATIATEDGGTKPLVKQTNKVFESGPPEEASFTPGPGLVFGLVLVVTTLFTFLDFRGKKRSRGLDFTLFLVAGLVGLLLIFLWFFTDHSATANNLNILWALPMHLIVSFFLFKKNPPKWLVSYFLLIAAMMVLLLLSWYFLPQPLHYSLLPLVTALGLRAVYFWYYHTKLHTNS